ncbi:unnamed protein product [Knipowitschia caucasica]
MAASNPELIPLIYRHLKEHGFHTAAEALQKQSIQNETPPPASLLDIYSSWLKTCKRKKKLSSSTPGKKPAKPIKAAAERKNKDKAAKQRGSPNKKSPTKEKKVDGKASEKKIKSNKKQAKKKKSGEDSDSDSSLDVEKWKKLVEQMTDADLAKVEEFNALAAPKPKRVRKSRAKPKPKSEDQPSKTPEKYTEDIVAQSNPTVAPVAALEISTQEQNVEIPVANVTPAKKQSAEKKKINSKDENPPKRKGKKVTMVANGDGEGLSHLIDKPVENNAEISNLASNKQMQESDEKISSSDLQTEPKKKKKKRTLGDGGSILLDDQNFEKDVENTVDKCNNDSITEDLSSLSNSAVVESTVKAKKKKKDKSKEDCVQTVTAVTTEETLEKLTEESNPLTEEVSISAQNLEKAKSPDQNPTKKKKKATTTPNMTTANGDGLVDKNVESCAETEKPVQESLENACDLQTGPKKKKKKHKSKEDCLELINSVPTEETLENVAEDSNPITEEMAPKKKKKKKDKSRVELDTLPPEDVIAETTQRTEKKKKKKKQCHVSEVPEEPSDPPSTPQTPGPKKKKHKLQPEELTEADPSSPTAENETPKKKKKKSTKGQGTES